MLEFPLLFKGGVAWPEIRWSKIMLIPGRGGWVENLKPLTHNDSTCNINPLCSFVITLVSLCGKKNERR
jgi:hypothetical protein